MGALRDGAHGVVLAGPAGVGKTAMARTLVDVLCADGAHARFVLGTETGKAVPLGAFQHTLNLTDAREPTVLLGAAHRALSDEPDMVLVVDDAQHLDQLSALLVQQLALTGTVRMIVTIRTGEPVRDALTALWKDRLLRRIELSPFTPGQTGTLAAEVLGGDVDEHAIAELHRFSAGSPLYLRGVLTAALADNAFEKDRDRWRLSGTLHASPDLRELVGSWLSALTPPELDVLEVISTAQVLDWQVLLAICGRDAVSDAERRGAIQVLENGSHLLVQPAHPLVGEVARARCPTARVRDINTLLAHHLSGRIGERHAGTDVRARIQLALFMTSGDAPLDLSVIVDAAASAVTMADLALGEQLAGFALERGAGVDAAILLADAVSWQGRGLEAESILAAHRPDIGDESVTARWGCLRAANLYFGCGDDASARAVLATMRDQVHAAPAVSLVVAMEVAFAFFAGDLRGAIAKGCAALRAGMLPAATVWTAAGTAGALALSGRFGEVAAVVAAGERAGQLCETGPQRYSLALAGVLSTTEAGQLDEADAVLRRYDTGSVGTPQADAIINALKGRVELARGHLLAACEALRTAVWSMSDNLPAGWVMLVAGWLAQAEAGRGDIEGAAAALSRAEQARGVQVKVFDPELMLAQAWVHAVTGEISAGRKCAERAAQVARGNGMHAVELRALHTALRLGDRAGNSRIQAVASQLDSPVAVAISLHSRALTNRDGGGLDAAADGFERIGALVLAADAAAHAAREHAHAGHRGHELESATRAHWLASQTGSVTPALRFASDPLPLTEREWEIADLVGAGLSNREVAGKLYLSVRTVDGHLYRIFAKLGIDDRDQLARLVRYRPAT